MCSVEKIKEYQKLCDLNNSEVCKYGDFYATVQYYGQILNGTRPLNDECYLAIMRAISKANAVKKGLLKPSDDKDKEKK